MNIALIGMSGAGKSYIGTPVAEALGLEFVDIDVLLETYAGKQLPEIIDELGEEAFVRVEAAATEKTCEGDGQLISTGGSVVYSEATMEYLREHSRVIYLRVAKQTIIERVSGNADREGRIVGLKRMTIADLIAERAPLYEQYAHVIVDLDGLSFEDAVRTVVDAARNGV